MGSGEENARVKLGGGPIKWTAFLWPALHPGKCQPKIHFDLSIVYPILTKQSKLLLLLVL